MSAEMNSLNNDVDAAAAAAAKQLASHPGASPETLKKLAGEESSEVVERVAENKQTPEEVLVELAEHPSAEVRSAVSENANASAEMMHKLAHDEHPDVRFRVAENANAPDQVLEHLTHDENPFVVARAQDTLSDKRSLSEQADQLLVEEKFAEAERLYKEVVDGLERLIGPNHCEVSKALHKLAAALIGQGKESCAIEAKERADRIKEAIEALP
jgi:hypothetical protein